MIVIYKRPTKKDIAEAVEQINEWFEQNPDRNDCNAQIFGGIVTTVTRGNVEEELTTKYQPIE